jgi:hypothetical protein
MRCSTATFTRLAAGGVVADGLSNLRRPGAVKSHLDLTKLTGLRASVLFDEPTTMHARGGDLPHVCNAYLRFKN